MSILVVDYGRHETTAAVVTGDQVRAVVCPAPAASQLDSAYLRAVVADAQAAIDRLTLTISTVSGRDEHQRAAMVRVAMEAGYPDAELVSAAVAAVMDPHTRAELPASGLVLVCDLGVAWSATLVRLDAGQPRQLAEEVAGENLTGAGLETLAEPALRWLIASCRAVVARAGYTMGDVAGLLMAGGGARLPAAAHMLAIELGRPMWRSPDPEYAVIRGAAAWAAAHAGLRAIAAASATWRVEPLSWTIPESARLLRWVAGEGQSYPEGACLAQIRTLDDRVYDLVASREGIMLEHRVRPGAYVWSGDTLAMSRSAVLFSNDRPVKRLEMKVSGDWMLTPDRTHLMECADSPGRVRMRDIDSGVVVHEVRAEDGPRHGRVFVHPGGRPALVCWDETGRFAVWDVSSGQLVSEFRAAARPLTVLVNEGEWRLVSEVDRQVSVGRYRRDVATMWDLDTGSVIEQMVGDDLRRHLTGYADRSRHHGFATEARSPDGRLRAGSTLLEEGRAAVWLHRADTGEEVFRAEVGTAQPVGSAFSADGRHLLSKWDSAGASCLEVWKI